MKKFIFILLFIVLVQNSDLADIGLELECITLQKLMQTTIILCNSQRNNKNLWNKVIECHRPMTDEFMRSSAEALCPVQKHVDDPTEKIHSMADVFFNICGLVEGSESGKNESIACIVTGNCRRGIMSHRDEVKAIKKKWGNDLPCNIGKCITKLDLA